MTYIHLVSGFLGAGKTSFLQKLLYHPQRPEGVALIENEFGKVALDKMLLQKENQAFPMYEIAKGCVCCSMQEDFKNTLYLLLKEGAYEHIFIEPSGVAKPSEIKKQVFALQQEQKRRKKTQNAKDFPFWKRLQQKIFSSYKDLEHLPEIKWGYTFHLLDAQNYFLHSENLKDFFDAQTKEADFLFINRFASFAQEERENLAEALQTLNKQAICFWENDIQDFDMQKIWALLATKTEVGSVSTLERTRKLTLKPLSLEKAKPFFESVTLWVQKMSMESTEAFLLALQRGEFGKIYRCKGIFAIETSLANQNSDVSLSEPSLFFYHLEYTPSTLQKEKYEGTFDLSQSHLILIGEDLQKEKWKQFFEKENIVWREDF